MLLQLRQAFGLVKPGMRRGKMKVRRMVDIKQNRVKFPRWFSRIKTGLASRHLEKITLDKPAFRIIAEAFAKWDQAAFMPANHRCQLFDNDKAFDARVVQCGIGGKAHAKPADN